jgi:hypothetical protein
MINLKRVVYTHINSDVHLVEYTFEMSMQWIYIVFIGGGVGEPTGLMNRGMGSLLGLSNYNMS